MSAFRLVKEFAKDAPRFVTGLPGFLRARRNRPIDVIFYCGKSFHERWIESTLSRLRDRLRCTLVVDRRFASPEQLKRKDVTAIPRALLPFLSAPVLVTPVSGLAHPLLEKAFRWRVHMPHSLVSLHMIYPRHAYEGYNAILGTGAHHARETAALDRDSKRPLRPCPTVGYGKMDLLLEEFRTGSHRKPSSRPCILLAPSWGKRNILGEMGEPLVEGLLEGGYDVILRPHPGLVTEFAKLLAGLEARHGASGRFRIENGAQTHESLYVSDLIISDYSGIAYEFAFLRERPALFIDVPTKVLNPDYEALETTPMELALRDQVGKLVPPSVPDALKAVQDLLDRGDAFAEAIRREREIHCVRFGACGAAAAEEIERLVGLARPEDGAPPA